MAPERLAAWDAPVDINRATVEELASLDGVGREARGAHRRRAPVPSLEDLARVRGIGRRRVARLRARLFLDGRAPDRVR